MKMKINRNIIVYSIIAALFIVPLVVFAVVYTSSERTNNFAPGSVDVAVHEGSGNNEGKKVKKEYHWTKDGTIYSANKEVQIKDTRKYPGEVLRVCFVPMWYDKETPANVCDVFNFGTSDYTDPNQLVYTDGDKTITLNLADQWAASGWDYREDGCFYYTGELGQNDLTTTLLESVQLNENAYALTTDYNFRLDVLADAIQITDHAAETRRWATTAAPQQSP